MCGIYGIVGNTTTKEVIKKLSHLEYRGYDSCGIAYIFKGRSFLYKTLGNTLGLKNNIPNLKIETAIGHTRWATHGCVTPLNAHPHTTLKNRFFIIHNGVIHNYKDLIGKYGFNVVSETDSEVIAHMLDYYTDSLSVIEAIKQIALELSGSFACVVLDKKEPNKLYFFKNKSPLLIAIDKNKIELSSDQLAFDNKMNVTILNDGNYGYVTNNSYQIYSFNYAEKWITFYKDTSLSTLISNHYMLDEIYYEPQMIKEIGEAYKNINLSTFMRIISDSNEIVFVGAGSSFYAAKILATYYERKLKKRTFAVLASEMDSFSILSCSTLFIFLSQSGETADLLEYARKLKGIYKIISLCNNPNSQLGYISDIVFPLLAKEEIAVASTKAFMAMIYVGKLLIDPIYYINNSISIIAELNQTLLDWNKIYNISKVIATKKCVFYIGKDIDYYIAEEASLKLKEVSYIDSYGYPSGELKHGSISLLDDDAICIGLISNPSYSELVKNNLIEAESRKALTFTISNIDSKADIYTNGDELSLILVIQIIAYQVAKILGRNIDQPRNLAKSVTVL